MKKILTLIAAVLAVGTAVPGRAAEVPTAPEEEMAPVSGAERYAGAPADEGLVEIHSYIVRRAQEAPGADMQQLVALTDVALLHKKMTSDEMSDYIKATRWQAKMVYFYSRLTGNDRDAAGTNGKGSSTASNGSTDQSDNGDESAQGVSLMTPLEFVHSLADDLFSRKALEPLVNRKQKEGLLIRRDIMDWADRGARFSEERLEEIVAEYISKTY